MMLDLIPAPAYVKNREGTYLGCNQAFLTLLGRAQAEVVGRTDYELFPRSVADKLFRLDSELLSQGGLQRVDAKLVHADGSFILVKLQRRVQKVEDQDEPCISAVVIDVTEEIREEHRRSASLVSAAAAEMAIQTIEGMIDPVIILNEYGIVEQVNRGYIDALGPAKDIIGKNVASLFQDINETVLARLLERCQEEDRIRNLEAIVMDQQGRTLPVLVTISKLRDSQRAINGFVIAIRDVSSDITDRKRGEQLQRALYSISEAAYFAKDVNNLFSLVHRILSKLVAIENLVILLKNAATGELECPYYRVEASDLLGDEAKERALHAGLVEYLLEKGQALLLNHQELQQMIYQGDFPQPERLPQQWLGVPLLNGEGTKIGAMVTFRYLNEPIYGEEDRKILNFVSCQIAMAIERRLNEDELRIKNQQLQLLTEGIILVLVRSVEIRDPYTAGHQQRVSLLASEIGRKLGLQEDRIAAVRIAALLHDVGKIAIPTELLSKPGKLSEIEMMLIRQHPVESYNILRNIQFPYPIAQYALEHHEKYDGSGYPAGLKADAISLEGRIICVADVVDAISSHRPYRPSRGLDQALIEIQEHAGTLYDPDVVAACLALFEEGFSFIEAEDPLAAHQYPLQ